ncbi:MAG: hypothetical protein Q4C42_01970 [Clostridia bacterium]|nr:hypothetical protein [Clostridia bacterium]
MNNILAKYRGKRLPSRIIAMLMGCIMLGFGVAVFWHTAMGADPYSTLNTGLSYKMNMSFGKWQAIINIALLAVVVIFDRSMIGLGTVGNMFLVGFSADFFFPMLGKIIPPTDEMGFIVRVLITVAAVLIQLVGCSFYITSDLGMSPYDSITYIIPDKIHVHFRWCRIVTDLICVIIGFVCGASVGIGTLLNAFGAGPMLPILNKYVAGPILKAENVRS